MGRQCSRAAMVKEQRHEYDMVSQGGTREGESICKALPKGPPTGHNMALQHDMTEQMAPTKRDCECILQMRGDPDSLRALPALSGR